MRVTVRLHLDRIWASFRDTYYPHLEDTLAMQPAGYTVVSQFFLGLEISYKV
jgi:hypothetical protein